MWGVFIQILSLDVTLLVFSHVIGNPLSPLFQFIYFFENNTSLLFLPKLCEVKKRKMDQSLQTAQFRLRMQDVRTRSTVVSGWSQTCTSIRNNSRDLRDSLQRCCIPDPPSHMTCLGHQSQSLEWYRGFFVRFFLLFFLLPSCYKMKISIDF